jgi:heat shock protein HspQ
MSWIKVRVVAKNILRSAARQIIGRLFCGVLAPLVVLEVILSEASFSVGQLVWHRLFHYRGVVIDVDPVFMGSEEWYQMMAKSQPPRDSPWYHVLVHNARHQTYVAERNLDADETGEPIRHPAVDAVFSGFDGHCYKHRSRAN